MPGNKANLAFDGNVVLKGEREPIMSEALYHYNERESLRAILTIALHALADHHLDVAFPQTPRGIQVHIISTDFTIIFAALCFTSYINGEWYLSGPCTRVCQCITASLQLTGQNHKHEQAPERLTRIA